MCYQVKSDHTYCPHTGSSGLRKARTPDSHFSRCVQIQTHNEYQSHASGECRHRFSRSAIILSPQKEPAGNCEFTVDLKSSWVDERASQLFRVQFPVRCAILT